MNIMTKEDVIKRLEESKFAVLATSDKDGNVSASQMCLINDGLDVYFQTDKSSEKISNIKENNKVAINIGSMYFKGVAKIVGHPTKSPKFIELIKEKHLKTYTNYTSLPNEILIKVKLVECKLWDAEVDNPIENKKFIAVYNLLNDKQKTIVCDKM